MGRRVRMVVRDLPVTNNHVMRQHAAHSFVEAAADRFIRHLEFRPCLGSARVQFLHRSVPRSRAPRSRVRLEVCARAIPFNRVTPLGDLPFKLAFRQRDGLRQIDLHAISRGLDVADIHHSCQRVDHNARSVLRLCPAPDDLRFFCLTSAATSPRYICRRNRASAVAESWFDSRDGC